MSQYGLAGTGKKPLPLEKNASLGLLNQSIDSTVDFTKRGADLSRTLAHDNSQLSFLNHDQSLLLGGDESKQDIKTLKNDKSG